MQTVTQPNKTASAPQPATPDTPPATASDTPFDASLMARDFRLHFEDGSHFLPEHYLMIHPAEMTPERQERTFAKLVKHLAIPHPSFFQTFPRNAVMLALASYLPVSKEARQESLKAAADKLEQQTNSGRHPDEIEQQQSYQQPLTAYVRLRDTDPQKDPVVAEYLRNAMSLYLLLNDALRERGRPFEAAQYISGLGSADTIMADLASRLGMRLSDFVDTAQNKGLAGLAEALNIPQERLAEIEQLTAKAAEQQYSENIVLNWDAGRRQPGMEGRSIDEKIAVGLLQRSSDLYQHLQREVSPFDQFPKDISEKQRTVVSMIRELPEPLQEALYYSGTEMAFTQGRHLRRINPDYGRALGIHHFLPFERGDDYGLRLIGISSLENSSKCRRIFHHEVNHLFFPHSMGKANIAEMDRLMQHGADRLSKLKTACDQWKAATSPEERRHIEQKIDQEFRVGEIGLAEALGRGKPNAASMDSLRDLVDHAAHNLDPHALALSKNYPYPQLRAAEIISRFAELKYVSQQDRPALLAFVAPELTVAYHDIYLPHIKERAGQFKQEQQSMPPQLKYLGLPPSMLLPKTQQQAMIPPQQAQLHSLLPESEVPQNRIAAPGNQPELHATEQFLARLHSHDMPVETGR